MCRTKSFTIIAVLSLILLFGNVNLACFSELARTPLEIEPPPEETEPPSYTSVGVSIEPGIPDYYATYTDASGLFTISYPSDWENVLSQTAELEQNAQEDISRLQSGLPLEASSVIFAAGRLTAAGYEPRLSIAIESMPVGVTTINRMIDAELTGMKKNLSDYQEQSRIYTTIDERQAAILDFEATSKAESTLHYLQMYMLVNNTAWVVSCTALPDDFADWEEDFDTIVRSILIYE